jgi:hypothetical protein
LSLAVLKKLLKGFMRFEKAFDIIFGQNFRNMIGDTMDVG